MPSGPPRQYDAYIYIYHKRKAEIERQREGESDRKVAHLVPLSGTYGTEYCNLDDTKYNKGKTNVNTLTDSVVSNMSTIDSSGYSASLVGTDVYSKGDALFTTYKQPMRVESGNITLTTANGLNMDDSISFSDQTVSLSPVASEKILTVGYSTDYSKDTAMTVLLNHRDNPNHDSTAKSENQIMLKMTKSF